MYKPILIKPDVILFRKIKQAARAEKRKPGPMVLILLERYFEYERRGSEVAK